MFHLLAITSTVFKYLDFASTATSALDRANDVRHRIRKKKDMSRKKKALLISTAIAITAADVFVTVTSWKPIKKRT